MQKKIYMLFIFLILFGILLTGLMATNLLENNYISSVEDKLISNTNLIIDLINRVKVEDYDNFTKQISKTIDSRITIIDANGKVLGDSKAEIFGLENHRDRPEVIDSHKYGIGKAQRFSDTINKKMYYVAISMENDMVIRLALPLDEIEESTKKMFMQIFISAISGIIFSLILGFRFLKGIIKPINELTTATKSIANGNYGEKVFLNSSDEIAYLANNFNQMSEELEKKINEINGRNDETKAILSSMINGIIAIDNKKNILFINKSVADIFGYDIDIEKAKDKNILEVFRNSELNDNINEMIYDESFNDFEMKIKNNEKEKTLKVFFNKIISEKELIGQIGYAIIVQDITEIRKLENMRKDFVANVSHEIKTPLTSIRGFVETLKNVDGDEIEIRKRFLNIIDLESKRLNSLIDDLLVISEIEKGNRKIEFEEINVKAAIDEVTLILNQLAKKKNIDFNVYMDNDLPEIYGNRRWFKQMLINLIDNGIKYTGESGKVTLDVKYNEKEYIFKVRDTGMGIAKEHLERLFERFYRVDKARSRKIGGTGLGLAIVKHAVNTFNGEITVNSKVDKGTEFVVKIPL